MEKRFFSLFFLIISLAPQQSLAQTSGQVTPSARPHGCIADGAAGAVAGHFMHSGHAVLEAMAGCAYGAWQRHKWKMEIKKYDSQKRTIIMPSDKIESHFQSQTGKDP
ncbi:hypothetical protein GOB83_06830 [Acetobacter fabarum]|uniref:hypothetical protein n=1 Tax=Acetobacter fabarum TaxID=483199 RepID=UPI001404AC54|nr:hypothetical protein [Acetobacter fabarum]NHO41906.1 hypothetical protein [Acetobacter fabarum]GBQ37003.1 hypothetical protein AA19596_2129 [Acetobacter fabarum DSM 19596]